MTYLEHILTVIALALTAEALENATDAGKSRAFAAADYLDEIMSEPVENIMGPLTRRGCGR